MLTGKLKLRVTDLLVAPVEGKVRVCLDPPEEGQRQEFEVTMAGRREAPIHPISVANGSGTLFVVGVEAKAFRPYRYVQRFYEGTNDPIDGPIWLVTDPKKVKDIDAPAFERLPAALRQVLAGAIMECEEPGDEDLQGTSGDALYAALGPRRKAALLNLYLKASHKSTTENCFRWVRKLRLIRENRCFVNVDQKMFDFLGRSDCFKSASCPLHPTMAGYELRQSFRSRDPHASLQITLFEKQGGGEWAADLDIDERNGFGHGMEVLRNEVTKGQSNPYTVRELLILQDLNDRTLDPLYRFVC